MRKRREVETDLADNDDERNRESECDGLRRWRESFSQLKS